MNEKESAYTFEQIKGAMAELEGLKIKFGVVEPNHQPMNERELCNEIVHLLAKHNVPAGLAFRALDIAKEKVMRYAVLITR